MSVLATIGTVGILEEKTLNELNQRNAHGNFII